jgi:hypothetical protein
MGGSKEKNKGSSGKVYGWRNLIAWPIPNKIKGYNSPLRVPRQETGGSVVA